MQEKVFDPLIFVFKDTSLIEASAGTGKTFTIIILFLRLLLGLGKVNIGINFNRLCINEILILTFTEFAIKELRYRIWTSIKELKEALYFFKKYKKIDSSILKLLLEDIKDIDLAIIYLLEAESKIDTVSIFTIHSLCYKILNQFPIETQMLCNVIRIETNQELLNEIIRDYWRKAFYLLPIEMINIIVMQWKHPEDLLKDVLSVSDTFNNNIYEYNELDVYTPLIMWYDKIQKIINDIKKEWVIEVLNIKKTLQDYNCNRYIYSTKNINFWIENINQWIDKKNNDLKYLFPECLLRFRWSVISQSISSQYILQNKIFYLIETLYQESNILKTIIFDTVLKYIAISKFKIKEDKNCLLNFDDLTIILNNAFKGVNGEYLGKVIRKQYPIAIIDEFQDTDHIQYDIIKFLYHNQSDNAMLLIGDPKQSIYSFRGADIFTYIKARNEVHKIYTLTTNWRSTAAMSNAINHLFLSVIDPFIIKDIACFKPVNSDILNKRLCLMIDGIKQPALSIWTIVDNITKNEYYQIMAKKCSEHISYLLNKINDNSIYFKNKKNKKIFVKTSDIVVLVRNYNEAEILKKVLQSYMVSSVYISNRDNIFNNNIMKEISIIIEAILFPDKKNILRQALMTTIFNFDIYNINYINNNNYYWNTIIKEFIEYRKFWDKFGIFAMLQQIILNNYDFLYYDNYKDNNNFNKNKYIIEYFDIAEFLQESFFYIENKYVLFNKLIDIIENNTKYQKEKVFSQFNNNSNDNNIIQIMTIHKAKGLEFPIVLIPFTSSICTNNFNSINCIKKNNELFLSKKALKINNIIETNKLAEDIRLLYVALTRSIYNCTISISSIICRKNKLCHDMFSNFHESALGYLILKGNQVNYKMLHKKLLDLSYRAYPDIIIVNNNTKNFNDINKKCLIPNMKNIISLENKKIIPHILKHKVIKKGITINSWNLTSYSILKKYNNNHNKTNELIDLSNVKISFDQKNLALDESRDNIKELNQFNFPKGKIIGVMLHDILKNINFENQKINYDWICSQLIRIGVNDVIWGNILVEWVMKIINSFLNEKKFKLTNLKRKNYYTEMNFSIAINSLIFENYKYSIICKKFDVLSARRSIDVFLPDIKGILSGFIDLVFIWKNKYYIVDYKSNHLGTDISFYQQQSIENEMIINYYDLQYQLYTLAIHRFLQRNLKNYKYEKHFGGVYYIFIRGINQKNFKNYVYFCIPNVLLIDQLDKLFK